jgi:hypothetical protein
MPVLEGSPTERRLIVLLGFRGEATRLLPKGGNLVGALPHSPNLSYASCEAFSNGGRRGDVAEQRSKLLGVALWESEEVMHSTEEVVSRIRDGIPHPLGGAVVDVENYEVFVLEVSS